jgi:hypothetical protein
MCRKSLSRISGSRAAADAAKLTRSVQSTPVKSEGSGSSMRRSRSAATVPRPPELTPRNSTDGSRSSVSPPLLDRPTLDRPTM